MIPYQERIELDQLAEKLKKEGKVKVVTQRLIKISNLVGVINLKIPRETIKNNPDICLLKMISHPLGIREVFSTTTDPEAKKIFRTALLKYFCGEEGK